MDAGIGALVKWAHLDENTTCAAMTPASGDAYHFVYKTAGACLAYACWALLARVTDNSFSVTKRAPRLFERAAMG